MHLAAQNICMFVVGKEASTLSTIHGIANCVKSGTRKFVCSNWYQRLAHCSVAHTYFQSSLRILFTVFLEMKTQLWKLMLAISGCCIGSIGNPLHPPLKIIEEFRSLGRKAIAMEEKMLSGLYISSTWTHRIYRVIEMISKFMLV